MDDWWCGLETTRAKVWRRLARGVADRRAAARHPVLATQGRGGWPEARTVVLRGVDAARQRIELHTDLASAKVAELRAHPRATLHVWDPRADLQIRLRAGVAVLTGADVADAWARVPDRARAVYGGSPGPGVPIPAPRAERSGPDPARFAVLRLEAEEIETLHLGRDLHRRAVFRRSAGWSGGWLVP